MQLVENKFTDKGGVHSYIGELDRLIGYQKNDKIKILEIGVYRGGSIAMWHDSFPNADIHGVDILLRPDPRLNLDSRDRVTLYEGDAYSDEVVNRVAQNGPFDFILDDGPHTLKSMKAFVRQYASLLNPDGALMIIEDVKQVKWFESIFKELPEDLRPYVNTLDLRANKNRKDDLMFVVDTRQR
jgi:hypothetical protein